MPRAKGTEIAMSPVISSGGCMNIPGCVSSGLIPMPSAGAVASCVKGLASRSMTPTKKVRSSISTPLAYARCVPVRRGVIAIDSAAMPLSAKATKSSEPSLPA